MLLLRNLPFRFHVGGSWEFSQEIHAMQVQLSEEPLQGGEATAPYGQRARVTPGRLAFVIREQMKTFNQVRVCR